jgi:hypothetical protein
VGRKGQKRAAVAVGHRMLIIADHVLTKREPYHDLGVTSCETRKREVLERRLIRRLEALGYAVSLHPKDPAA